MSTLPSGQLAMYAMPSSNSSSARGSLLESHSSGNHFSAMRVTCSSMSHCTAFSTPGCLSTSRRVRHHLVVEEVVARGQHHRAVDEHQVAPVGGFKDLDELERRLHLVQLLG